MRLVLLTWSLLLFVTPPANALESENEELQNLVDQLKEVTQKARQQRAADRWLLNDLEDIVARYDWPWRDELLAEDFSDGDYNHDPQWQVFSGQFWVDGRLGLRSRAQPQKEAREETSERKEEQDLGKALLGALLQEALRDKRQEQKPEPEPRNRRNEPAIIELAIPIPKVFAARFEFSVHNRPSEQGNLALGVLQDNSGSYGYRINLFTGERPQIELVTLRKGRTQILDSADLGDISDGDTHTLEWRRDPNGNIEVLVDDSSLIKTRDNTFRDSFKWLAVANYSGDFAISSIGLHGLK